MKGLAKVIVAIFFCAIATVSCVGMAGPGGPTPLRIPRPNRTIGFDGVSIVAVCVGQYPKCDQKLKILPGG